MDLCKQAASCCTGWWLLTACCAVLRHAVSVRPLQSSGACAGLLRATACYSSSYLVLDLSSRPWRVLHMNEPAVQATGVCGAHRGLGVEV